MPITNYVIANTRCQVWNGPIAKQMEGASTYRRCRFVKIFTLLAHPIKIVAVEMELDTAFNCREARKLFLPSLRGGMLF